MNQDPIAKNSANAERALFNLLAKASNGFSREQVIGAAANVIVNALRQEHDTQSKALNDFDALTAKVRELIASHYDVLGRRRNVFPFHQTIEVPLFKAKKTGT